MTGINDMRPSLKNDGHQNSDKIRQDIAQAEQEMSQTVGEIGERIKEKLDWQAYVKDTPYLALGIAAGLGYIAAGVFVKKKTSMDRLLDTVSDEVRSAASGMVARAAGPGLIKVTLLGIASKAAVNWLQNVSKKQDPNTGRNRPECRTTPNEAPVDSRIVV